MKKPVLSTTTALVLSVILALLGAFGMVWLAQLGINFPWVIAPAILATGLIVWIISLAVPRGDFDPLDYYVWRVENTPTTLNLVYKDLAAKRKSVFWGTLFQSLFVMFGLLLVVIAIGAVVTTEGVMIILICVPIGLGLAAQFAYALWKSPLTASAYHFDDAKNTLTVEGFTRFLRRTRITVPFDAIEKIHALSVKATAHSNHDLIRIDILNPKRYLTINSGELVDSEAEIRFYLAQIARLLPTKTIDEVGSGKLWVNP